MPALCLSKALCRTQHLLVNIQTFCRSVLKHNLGHKVAWLNSSLVEHFELDNPNIYAVYCVSVNPARIEFYTIVLPHWCPNMLALYWITVYDSFNLWLSESCKCFSPQLYDTWVLCVLCVFLICAEPAAGRYNFRHFRLVLCCQQYHWKNMGAWMLAVWSAAVCH